MNKKQLNDEQSAIDTAFATTHLGYDEGDESVEFFKADPWGTVMLDIMGKGEVDDLLKSLSAMEQVKDGVKEPIYFPKNVGLSFHPLFAKKIRQWLEMKMKELRKGG